MAWFWSWPCWTCWIWFLFILAKPGKPILSFGYFCLFWPIFDCLGLFGSIWAYLGLLNTYSEIMAWYGSWPCWTCWKWFLFIMAKPWVSLFQFWPIFDYFCLFLPILVMHFKCHWSIKIAGTKDKKQKACEIPYILKIHNYSMLNGFALSTKAQCWTVGAISTFGRSRMFGPDKLRPLAVGRSRSRRLKIKENMS